MYIKDGYFAILYDGSEYETINIKKDRQGNYKLRSTNLEDLKYGFKKSDHVDGVFIKIVSESEIEKIKRVRPYAILKGDPDENKFDILRNSGLNKDNSLTLVTTNHILAEKFSFSSFGYRTDGTFAKVVSEKDVIIKYEEKGIFFKTPSEIGHGVSEKTVSKDEGKDISF